MPPTRGFFLTVLLIAITASAAAEKADRVVVRKSEGRYVLDSKNANSAYYKAIHISYPNSRDIAAAKARGVRPGGLIMIHGQKDGFGWL